MQQDPPNNFQAGHGFRLLLHTDGQKEAAGPADYATLCSTPRCAAGLSPKGRRNNAYFDFWDVVSQIANGLVFFFVGASVVNFFLRWGLRVVKRRAWASLWFPPPLHCKCRALRHEECPLNPELNLATPHHKPPK
jgi:hypothetical protein